MTTTPKVRGGIVYMDSLKRSRAKVTGVISATRGNHGQPIAFSASRADVPATIYASRQFKRAGRSDIATYVQELAVCPAARGRLAIGLANATLCQRLTIIPLFYGHLVEEGVRPANLVGRGSAGGAAGRAMIQAQRRLPWIPSEDDGRARQSPTPIISNRSASRSSRKQRPLIWPRCVSFSAISRSGNGYRDVLI